MGVFRSDQAGSLWHKRAGASNSSDLWRGEHWPILHPDGGDALLATQAVAEDKTPVDQQEGEEVPANWLRLRHVEDQTVALLGLDLETEVGVEPDGRHQVHRHPAVLPTEPGWRRVS